MVQIRIVAVYSGKPRKTVDFKYKFYSSRKICFGVYQNHFILYKRETIHFYNPDKKSYFGSDL